MEKKKFLDMGGAEVIAGKINLLATVVDGLMELDHIKVIPEARLQYNANVNTLEKNVQYNLIDKEISQGLVYVHNSDTNKKSFHTIQQLYSLDPEKNTPIGIVVIPSNHNVYYDGSVGIMALKSARTDTPDTGGEEQGISWGEYGSYDDGNHSADISEIQNFADRAPCLPWTPNIQSETTGQQTFTGSICLDWDTHTSHVIANPFDRGRGWEIKNGTHIASAFQNDGSRNPQYNKGITADIGIAYFEKYKAVEGKVLAAIDAVVTCGENWYLPTVGEFAYAVMCKNELNRKLSGEGRQLIQDQKHWTTSRFDSSNVYFVDADNGEVAYSDGNSEYLVRPVMKVSGAGNIGQFYNGTSFVDEYSADCIGIVIIPTSHDVYGDGSCCVMALQYATPTGFGEAVGIKMFEFNTAESDGSFVPEDVNNSNICYGLDGKPYIDHSGDVSEYRNPYTYLPSDNFSGPDSTDGRSFYYYNSGPFAPAPERGRSKNASFQKGCFSDFNGKSNTAAMLRRVTVENWQTINTINNPTIVNGDPNQQSMPKGEFPAACACWRYHTAGTAQGDWYLPAVGELAYCCVYQSWINYLIAEIKAWKSGVAAEFLDSNCYWSSTESDSMLCACGINFQDGCVGSNDRYRRLYVRPFLRVSDW